MVTASKTSRRWLQFSLRSLLVSLTAFSVWLGIQVDHAKQQREIVLAIRSAGGMVSYEYETGENQPAFSQRLRRWFGEDLFYNVVSVSFWYDVESPFENIKFTEDAYRELLQRPTHVTDGLL